MVKIIIVIAVILGVTALIGLRDKKAAEEKAVLKLREEFGAVRDKVYPDGRLAKVNRYFLRHAPGFCIDDITWNDLEMDAIFARMDRTCSWAGEEYLYYMLRCPCTDRNSAPQYEPVLWWKDHEEERIRTQRALAIAGNQGKYSLYDYLDALDDLQDRPLSRDIPALLMPAAALAVMFFHVQAGLILLIAVLGFNMVQYFRIKAGIDPYLQSFRFILRMVSCAKRLSGADMPEFAGKKTVKDAAEALSFVSRGGRILMRGEQAGAANPLNLIMDYLCILFHIDLMVYGRMLVDIRGHSGDIDALIGAIGALDAQISIASFAASLPCCCAPSFEDGPFLGRGIYHPLLDNPVPSDISTERPVLITGSNASGKSTFLKTAALCALLGQSVGIVPASEYRGTCYRIFTSMALRDNLKSAESYFLVEIRSLKRVLDAAGENESGKVLCCVDEVLRGTNTLERISASTEILRALADKGVQVFAATHDLELTALLAQQYDNYHFQEDMDAEDIRFTYQLMPGSADSRNAIRLLRMLGYDAGIVERAQERAEHFLETGEWK